MEDRDYLSCEVTALLSVKYCTLFSLVRGGAIARPKVAPDGCFRWTPENIEAARAVLAARQQARKAREAARSA
jgi:hypothetical protein